MGISNTNYGNFNEQYIKSQLSFQIEGKKDLLHRDKVGVYLTAQKIGEVTVHKTNFHRSSFIQITNLKKNTYKIKAKELNNIIAEYGKKTLKKYVSLFRVKEEVKNVVKVSEERASYASYSCLPQLKEGQK